MSKVTKMKVTKLDTSKFHRVWQDREIRFDVSPSMLKCRNGEKEYPINSVEDTKGNNGHKGFLCSNVPGD